MPSKFDTSKVDPVLLGELVLYYFDISIPAKMMQLGAADKDRCFKMLEDYADVLEKLFVPGVDNLEHIQNKRWDAAKANPHDGIDFSYACPIIKEWNAWKDKQA
jgi:hypothetical protein